MAEGKQYTSIWLRENASPRHILFCMNCQYPLMKYQGMVTSAVPGDAGFESGPMRGATEIQCKGDSPMWGKCRAMYIIGFTE